MVLTDAFVAPTPGTTDYWRALDAVAAHAGTARLIIFTALRERDFPDFRGHGFTAILVQPCRLATLVATVADALLPRDAPPLHAPGAHNPYSAKHGPLGVRLSGSK